MVEEERASVCSEALQHPTEREVIDEDVAMTCGAGAIVEAQSEEVDALEDMDRCRVVKATEEAGGPTPAKLRSMKESGCHGSTLAESSGAIAVVQAGESEESEAESDDLPGWNNEIVEVAHEVINEEVDREEPRRYSIKEFGRILHASQWSLADRIEVCKVLECSELYNPSMIDPEESNPSEIESNDWMMTPLSRQEYAKQSLALIRRTDHGIIVNDLSVLEEMSSLVKKVTIDDIKCLGERSMWQLRKDMMGHVFGKWKELRELLEEELESLRETDTREEWYKCAFEGKDLQPWQIYAAIEKGDVGLMAKIGKEHWGKLKPREYRGATPLHWAALHDHVDGWLWGFIHSDSWPELLFDDFGFKPVHMAIFASSFLPASRKYTDRMSTCLQIIKGHALVPRGYIGGIVDGDLPCMTRTDGWNFVVCPLIELKSKRVDSSRGYFWQVDSIELPGPWDKRYSGRRGEEEGIQYDFRNFDKGIFFVFKWVGEYHLDKKEFTFVARCYFNTPIHQLHLAIWIGHPLLVERLIHSSKGSKHFSVKTDDGDTILHLAFKAMDLIGDDGDRIKSKGMDYAARKQVLTIMMRNLHYYPHMVNSQNEDGQTPLHITIFQGNLWCVRALLKCDYVNYNIKNKKGVTPIDMVLKLDFENSRMHRMYANHMGRACTVSDEVGFTTMMCNDVGFHGEYGEIIDHLMELDSDIVRQRRILQLSQWSFKHRIYALQMLIENRDGLEGVKGRYLKQCFQVLYPGECVLSVDGYILNASDQELDSVNAIVLEKLKIKCIEELSRRSRDEHFEVQQRLFAEIEDGDDGILLRYSNAEVPLTEDRSYKGANSLHWAILHGELSVLNHFRKVSLKDKMQRKIVDVTDGSGFTCLHFALFYTFLHRLNQRYKPFLQSDERFTSNYDVEGLRRDRIQCYNQMIDMLHEMSISYTDLYQGSWKDDNHAFVLWSISSTDVIHVDNSLTPTYFHPIRFVVHCAHPENFKRLLETTPEEFWTDSNVETGDTILHDAEGWEALLRHCSIEERGKIEFTLVKKLRDLKLAVNSRNWNRETPLHKAVRAQTAKWVGVLLQFEYLRFNLRDQDMLTPGECAAKMLQETPLDAEVKKIVDLLDCYDPESWPRKKEMERKIERDEETRRMDAKLEEEKKLEGKRQNERDEEKRIREKKLTEEKRIEEERKVTEGLQRERQVYVDAANAILVGGALIASASFGAFLQPPLGLQPYYSPEFLDTSAPPPLGPIYDSYVAIQQHWTIHAFWILNSLSFFLSLATVIAGANAALPSQVLTDQAALDSVKRAVKIEAWLLIASILAVIGTFAMVGFTVLPPIRNYHINMVGTLVVGGVVCGVILRELLVKLWSPGKTQVGQGSLTHHLTPPQGSATPQPQGSVTPLSQGSAIPPPPGSVAPPPPGSARP